MTDHIARVYAEGTIAYPIPVDDAVTRQAALPSNWFECADGFTFSVLAGIGAHCHPKPGFPFFVSVGERTPIDYAGPYVAVEVGFPSARPEPWSEWEEYAESDDDRFLYGMVPERMVRALVELHGGEVDPV